MKLYLLRHGQAEELDSAKFPSDSVRPLTARGERNTRRLARALGQWEVTFDVILSSDLVRARDTADLVAEGLGSKGKVGRSEHLAPGGDARELIKEINKLSPTPGSLLLVGHEPDLGRLVSLFCTGGYDLPIFFKKGGLCRLDVSALKYGCCAVLEWMIPPGVLD